MHRRLTRLARLSLVALLASASATAAHAARPMITDDARLTDPQACQLESWFHQHRQGNELWALPACNPGGNFEFTFGGALARSHGQMESSARMIQGKTLFKALETNGYGVGFAAGYATQPGAGQSGTPYFYVPTSLSFADDRLVIHTNLGATRLRERSGTRLTWGLGSEIQTTEHLYLIAETYGQNKGNPFFQFGVRYWVVPNHVQIDTTYGSQSGHLHDERWFSIGLRLISPRLF